MSPRSVLMLSMVTLATQIPPAAEGEKPAQAKEQTRTDRYGDPLPDGVMARLGTQRLTLTGGAVFVAFRPTAGSWLLTTDTRSFVSGRLLQARKFCV